MSLFLNLGWTGGANRDAADEAIREGREVQVGPLERLFGATVEDAENIVKKRTQKALQNQYGGQLAQLGLMVDWGDTEADIQRKIGTRTQERADKQVQRQDAQAKQALQIATKEKEKERGLTREIEGNKLTAQDNQLTAQLEASRQQYAHQSKTQEARYAFEGEQARLDRGLERDLSNNSADMQMQIAQMNSDLADKRMAYDRETRRMDRRDRAIAQLMAGLGQLGGAFSL